MSPADRHASPSYGDATILRQIDSLVDQIHQVTRHSAGAGPDVETTERIDSLESALDACWDLLRQRRALRGAGRDPDLATARSISEVRAYLQ